METEARYWTSDENRLIRAVLANDIVQTKRLMAELEDRRIIDDLGWYNAPLPLFYLTIANQIIFGDVEEHSNKEEAIIEREKINAMVEFWKEYFCIDTLPNIDLTPYFIDYYVFDNNYYLSGEVSDYVAQGYRAIDVELYCAAQRLDYNCAKQLLEQGADPNVKIKYIDANEYFNTFWSIGGELSWLEIEFQEFMEDDKRVCREIELGRVMTQAAHSEMYRLLEKYRK